jgi:hypothetical protein
MFCSLLLKAVRMCQHVMLFYEDAYPAEAVSLFFAAGLEAGDRCLALLSARHRSAVERCLEARGIAIESAAYVAVDSDEAMELMRVEGKLDIRRATELLAPLMTSPDRERKCRLRAAGDLAVTLCAAGNMDDAVAFENLVHRLTQEHEALTICAYPFPTRSGGMDMNTLLRLSAEHAAIEFPQRLWTRRLM